MADDPVFLLDLPLKCDPEVLNGCGNLHFLLTVVIVSIDFLQLHFLGLDEALGVPHFHNDFVVLLLEVDKFVLDSLGHVDPLSLLVLELALHPFQLTLVLLLHGSEGVDQFFNNFEGFLNSVVALVVLATLDALFFPF